MNYIRFRQKYDFPLAVALGFFDCIHKGHAFLVETAKDYAIKNDAQSALLTFCNDPSERFGGDKQIYDFRARASVLENLGLDNLIYADFNTEFSELSPIQFLDLLTDTLNIKYIIVGKDYTFGKNALGDITLLKEYCKNKQIIVDVKDFKTANGKKISTSDLKNLVKIGDIKGLNNQLISPYFVMGTVMHERNVGHKLGFPTANISLNANCLSIATGIYATKLYVDGLCYNSMTNIGAKPTFSVETTSIETFVFDFNGNLYEKDVKLEFYDRTRDVTKFASVDELKAQLSKDEQQIRKILSEV